MSLVQVNEWMDGERMGREWIDGLWGGACSSTRQGWALGGCLLVIERIWNAEDCEVGTFGPTLVVSV